MPGMHRISRKKSNASSDHASSAAKTHCSATRQPRNSNHLGKRSTDIRRSIPTSRAAKISLSPKYLLQQLFECRSYEHGELERYTGPQDFQPESLHRSTGPPPTTPNERNTHAALHLAPASCSPLLRWQKLDLEIRAQLKSLLHQHSPSQTSRPLRHVDATLVLTTRRHKSTVKASIDLTASTREAVAIPTSRRHLLRCRSTRPPPSQHQRHQGVRLLVSGDSAPSGLQP